MKILIVEDEQEIIESIVKYIGKENIECDYSYDIENAKNKLAKNYYDLCIVDMSLPDGSGMELIIHIKWRSPETVIIILSEKNSVGSKVECLNLGADDYLTKPFNLSELDARINSLLRRKYSAVSKEIITNEIRVVLDTDQVFIKEKMINLTRKEYELLTYLIINKNKVITKQAIVNHIWKDHSNSIGSFDLLYGQIKNLRKKLELNGIKNYIQNVNGIGYRFLAHEVTK
jgi:DNA-binding response OmpR family regulator